MSTSRNNALTRDYHGKFGQDFILRTRGGVSVMCKPHDYSKKIWTGAQKENRRNFKLAVIWAKSALLNEKVYRYYKKKARGWQTATNMAVRDYMKHLNLEMDMSQYKVGKGGKIIFKSKSDFGASSVNVELRNEFRNKIQTGSATITDKGKRYEYQVINLQPGEKLHEIVVYMHRGPVEFFRLFKIPNEFQ